MKLGKRSFYRVILYGIVRQFMIFHKSLNKLRLITWDYAFPLRCRPVSVDDNLESCIL